MKHFYPVRKLMLVGAAVLSGCAVYVPTVPSTPLLRSKGEVEITGAIRAATSLEAGAAWSPASHLIVTGETALLKDKGSQTYNNVTTNYHDLHLQGGVGVGTYRLLGKDKSVYLAALGGIGLATANIHDTHVEDYFYIFPIFSPLVHYRANYLRYYGQVYLAKQVRQISFGASVRNTWLTYSKLRRDGVPINSPTHFFLEPTLFMRVGNGAVQGVGTLGVSTPVHMNRQAPNRRNFSPVTTLISLGLVVRPHLLRHRDPPVMQVPQD